MLHLLISYIVPTHLKALLVGESGLIKCRQVQGQQRAAGAKGDVYGHHLGREYGVPGPLPGVNTAVSAKPHSSHRSHLPLPSSISHTKQALG